MGIFDALLNPQGLAFQQAPMAGGMPPAEPARGIGSGRLLGMLNGDRSGRFGGRLLDLLSKNSGALLGAAAGMKQGDGGGWAGFAQGGQMDRQRMEEERARLEEQQQNGALRDYLTGLGMSEQDVAFLTANPAIGRDVAAQSFSAPDRPSSFDEWQLAQQNPDYADFLNPPERFRPLTDPAERANYGIPPTDATPYQVGSDNRVYAVGGGGTEINLPGQPMMGNVPAGYVAVPAPEEPGGYRFVAISGGPATGDQANANVYAERMEVSSPLIDQYAASGMNFGSQLLGGFGVVGNVVLGGTDPEYQLFAQATRDFINATLRRESGAVISPEEFANARQQYIPMPGDTPAVLAQKQRNRELITRSIRAASGPFANPSADVGAASDDPSDPLGLF